jgi:hypothetical protein
MGMIRPATDAASPFVRLGLTEADRRCSRFCLRACLSHHSALFCMDIDFILLKLPWSNQPRIIPADRIKNVSSALDIDTVQKKSVSSTDETFWIVNTTASPARIMPIMSLAFMPILPSLKLFFICAAIRKPPSPLATRSQNGVHPFRLLDSVNMDAMRLAQKTFRPQQDAEHV